MDLSVADAPLAVADHSEASVDLVVPLGVVLHEALLEVALQGDLLAAAQIVALSVGFEAVVQALVPDLGRSDRAAHLGVPEHSPVPNLAEDLLLLPVVDRSAATDMPITVEATITMAM